MRVYSTFITAWHHHPPMVQKSRHHSCHTGSFALTYLSRRAAEFTPQVSLNFHPFLSVASIHGHYSRSDKYSNLLTGLFAFNLVLFNSCPHCIQNGFARHKSNHVTPLLKTLQWLLTTSGNKTKSLTRPTGPCPERCAPHSPGLPPAPSFLSPFLNALLSSSTAFSDCVLGLEHSRISSWPTYILLH